MTSNFGHEDCSMAAGSPGAVDATASSPGTVDAIASFPGTVEAICFCQFLQQRQAAEKVFL